ncbi:competence protein ComE, partial [Enterococcus faecium]|nr:competence protein ComE [Enterococcus faecium]
LLQAGVKGINYLHDYRNDPYAQALIEQLGVSVHQVALDSQHFSKLQNELTGKHV